MMFIFKRLNQLLIAGFVVFVLSLGLIVPAAAEGVFQNVKTVAYGTFNGIEYVKHTGTFVGAASGGSYSAPFEIIAPADTSQGTRRFLLEPLHPIDGAVIRERGLGDGFLLGQGFGYAAICFGRPSPSAPTTHPCREFSGGAGDGAEIVAAFGLALRADSLATSLVGGIQKLYASGHSAASEPLRDLLHSPMGKNRFDLVLPVGVPWSGGLHELPKPDAGRVMVLLAEADILNLNSAALRGTSATYRTYEVAGASHVISAPDKTPLSWAPVLRALFVAGDRWATVAEEPPDSIVLADDASAGDGIARDENGNALGGIRLPDLELGRGRYIAVDATLPAAEFGMSNEDLPKQIPLSGAFEDLKCTPLADWSPRFPDHGVYVRRFNEHAQRLVAQGYLLREDADQMIAEATASDVGEAAACADTDVPDTARAAADTANAAADTANAAADAADPADAADESVLLPDTGGETSGALALNLAMMVGMILVGAGIGLRRLTKRSY